MIPDAKLAGGGRGEAREKPFFFASSLLSSPVAFVSLGSSRNGGGRLCDKPKERLRTRILLVCDTNTHRLLLQNIISPP